MPGEHMALPARPAGAFLSAVQHLPDAFLRDYQQMRERQRWLRPDPDAEISVPTARQLADELDAFLRRWQAQVSIPPIRRALAQLRPEVDGILAHLRELRRVDHWELLEARMDWHLANAMIQVSVKFIEMVKHAPPELRPGMEKIYREHMGHDFDPEREFRDTEAEADKCEADFHRHWREFQENWPEDATAATHQRLLDSPIEALKTWQLDYGPPPAPTRPATRHQPGS